MSDTPSSQRGFIKYIIILVVVAAVLAYFGITATDIVESAPVQFLIGIWDRFLEPIALYIWNEIIIGFIWKYAVIFFESL